MRIISLMLLAACGTQYSLPNEPDPQCSYHAGGLDVLNEHDSFIACCLAAPTNPRADLATCEKRYNLTELAEEAP